MEECRAWTLAGGTLTRSGDLGMSGVGGWFRRRITGRIGGPRR